jgi:hypothetical protein
MHFGLTVGCFSKLDWFVFIIIKIKINDALCNIRFFWDGFKNIIPPGNGNAKTGICVFAVMINMITD